MEKILEHLYEKNTDSCPIVVPIEWRYGLQQNLGNIEDDIISITPNTYAMNVRIKGHYVLNDVMFYKHENFRKKVIKIFLVWFTFLNFRF